MLLVFGLMFSLKANISYAQVNDSKPVWCNSLQEPLFVWMGFNHSWTYNHRLNRLGDWAFYNAQDKAYTTGHSGATGLGADSACYQSYTLWASAPDVSGAYLSTELNLIGKEKKLISTTTWVPLPANYQPDTTKFTYEAILNGFDIVCLGKADKPQRLALSAGKPQWVDSLKTWAVPVEAKAVFNCQSLECEVFVNEVDYRLTVHVLALRLPKAIKTSNLQYEAEKAFDKHHKLDTAEANVLISHKPLPEVGSNHVSGWMGFQAFDFELNKAHWYVTFGLNTYSSIASYPADNDPIYMTYLQSQAGPKSQTANPQQAKFSMRRKGEYSIKTTLLFVPGATFQTVSQHSGGSMYWPGKNGSALHPDAVQERVWEVPLPTTN